VPQCPPQEGETLESAQRAFIARALDEANWVIAGPRGAAARLGIKRSTLQAMLKRLGLSRPHAGGNSAFGGRMSDLPGRMPDESCAVG